MTKPTARDRRAAWESGVIVLPIDCPDAERDNWFTHGGMPAYRMAWLELNVLAQAVVVERRAHDIAGLPIHVVQSGPCYIVAEVPTMREMEEAVDRNPAAYELKRIAAELRESGEAGDGK